jgi:hypothetical protein
MPDFAIVENARKLGARLAGLYALNIFLPLSAMDDRRRLRRRARRAIANRHMQPTRLAQIEWFEALPTVRFILSRRKSATAMYG